MPRLVTFLCALGLAAACALPGCAREAEAPDQQTTASPARDAPTVAPAALPPPPPIAAPLAIGSQDARDDLYCAGVLFAAHPSPLEAQVPVEEARILKGQMLGFALQETGVQKLIAEGVAVSQQTTAVADAWIDLATRDFDAGTARMSLETCTGRANALPPPPG